MPDSNHVHSWVRWQIILPPHGKRVNKMKQGEMLFKCNLPDCTSTIEKSLIKGKNSICPKCGKVFILDKYAINKVIPVCIYCRNTKESKMVKELQEQIDRDLKLNQIEQEKIIGD